MGVQNFAELRQAQLLYVDKIALIFDLVKAPKGFYFLSRPRRFGKSLLLSTIESLFKEGLTHFKGLAIERLWTEKETYPVIHLDLSKCTMFNSLEEFKTLYEGIVVNGFSAAGIPIPEPTFANEPLSLRLDRFFLQLPSSVKPVILIDEYDAPLNFCLDKKQLLKQVSELLTLFYITIKSYAGKLRFFFVTGICKYQELRVFSSGTFIKDISMSARFATLLGYTEEELLLYFRPLIQNAATSNGMSFDECFMKMKQNYDGFCFDENGKTHVLVPWSTLNYLNAPEDGFKNYWYESGGQPEILIKYLQEHAIKKPEDYGQDLVVDYESLRMSQGFELQNDLSLLAHTGYITVKKKINDAFALMNYPNLEVSKSMATLFARKFFPQNLNTELILSFSQGNTQSIVKQINELLLSIPHLGHPVNNESILRMLLGFTLVTGGFEVNYEAVNALGRSDLEVRCGDLYYVIELKFAREGDDQKNLLEKAIAQVKEKHYGEQNHTELTHIRIALVFSEKEKIFTEYAVF